MILSDNSRIAKNTIMLYFRMLFTMGVSLYTSRIVLNTLGVDDFGIYSVVGGIVAMFSFLNSSMSAATQRFLTFELGKNDITQLGRVFSISFNIHAILAIIVLLLAELIGVWFINNHLTIPIDRIKAANWVFQFSVFATIVSILKVPYSSVIIAHEKMGIYAYISIIEATLKLIIVFMLVIGEFDKLILYSFLMFMVSIMVSSITIGYCKKNFRECRLRIIRDNKILRPMLSFSAWDLYGNFSIIIRGQGVNVLQNIFFGPAVNAATAIANQVQFSIAGFADNFLTAVRPQIVKNYASNDLKRMQLLIYNASKFSFLLLLLISAPLIIENAFVLNLWLKNVPDYAIIFCQLSLINNLISIVFRTISFSIHATGKIKRISFINGTIYMMVLPISYVLFQYDFSPTTPFIVNIILLLLGCTSNLITLKLYMPSFSIKVFSKKVILTCLIVSFLSLPIPLLINNSLSMGWLRLVLVVLTSSMCISIFTYFIAMDKELRKLVKIKISTLIKWKN